MRNSLFPTFFIIGFIYAQPSPHTMIGYIRDQGGVIPPASCISFKAYIAGKPDTLFYPADCPVTNYIETTGMWLAQISSLNYANGDVFVVSFRNICNSNIGSDTAIVNTGSGDTQEMGTTQLNVPTSIGSSEVPNVFYFDVSPFFSNLGCHIRIIADGHISIDVFNVLGQSMGRIFDGVSNGQISLDWNPSPIAPGIYFIRAIKDSVSYTRKVFIIP